MPSLPPIVVRHPQPFDIVDEPVGVSGIGTGFEGQFAARLRDGNGAELARVGIQAGGTGVWGNFHITIPLGAVPATAQGTLEVFGESAADGSEVHKIVVPITFGRALVDPYHGFGQHEVSAGETLSAIAQTYYGDSGLWNRIFEANRDQISNPNLIFPGQVLRIPQ